MTLEDLRKKLEELQHRRIKKTNSLEYIIHKQTKCPISRIYVPDEFMDLPDLKDVKLFLKLDKTNQLPYIPEKFDCDNFSGVLRAKAMLYSEDENWTFGECETNKYGGHRFNFTCVKPNAQIYYIEPKTDSFFTNPGKFKFLLL